MKWTVKMPMKMAALWFLGISVMLMTSQFAEADQPKLIKKSIIVADAETGDTATLRQGRKLKVMCNYRYRTEISYQKEYAPTVQINVDGQAVSNQKTSVVLWVSGTDNVPVYEYTSPPVLWEAKILGTHTVTCSIDPKHPLGKTDTTVKETFVVEATPIYQVGNVEKSPMLSTKPMISKPDLIILTANTSITPNCGLGQTVATLNVEVKNVGLGPVFPTPDKPLKLRVDADAGLVDQEVVVGALNPGQTLPLTVGLKPVGAPKSLAGSILKLQITVNPKNSIEESNYSNNAVTIGLSFPANFCTSPRGAAQATPTPGSGRPGTPSSPQLPAVR